MTSLNSLKTFRPKMCEVHGEPKEYFCVSKECMTDLCRLCLTFHQALHDEQGSHPMIEDTSRVLQLSLEKLNRMLWGYKNEQKKLDRVKSIKENEWEVVISAVKDKVSTVRQKLESVLESFCREIKNQLLAQYIFPSKRLVLEAFDTPLHRLQMKIDKIEGIKKYITRDQKEKEMLKYVFYKDDKFILENLSKKVDQIIEKESRFVPDAERVEIDVKADQVSTLYRALDDFVKTNVSIKDLVTDTSFANFTHFNDNSHDFSLSKNYKDYPKNERGGESLEDSLHNMGQEPRAPPKPMRNSREEFSEGSKKNLITRSSAKKSQFGSKNPQISSKYTFAENSDRDYKERLESRTKSNQDDQQEQNDYYGGQIPRSSNKKQYNSTSDDKLQQFEIYDGPLPLDLPNYFQDDAYCRILHYFEPNTKNFYYADLNDLQKRAQQISSQNFRGSNQKNSVKAGSQKNSLKNSADVAFEKFELQINFLIPRHHRSLITPNGNVFLIGGLENSNPSNPQQSILFSSRVYTLDFERVSLQQISPMLIARAAFAALIMPMGILVAGGLIHDPEASADCDTTSSVEFYSFADGHWVELEPLKEPVINATLCLLNDQTVLKIGGKFDNTQMSNVIELFDLQRNLWTILEDKIGIPPLPALACALALDDGLILFCGGNFEEYADKTDAICLLELGKKRQIRGFWKVGFSLPAKEGFLNQQLIVENGRLFALQNVPSPKSETSTVSTQRKALAIEKDRCVALN